ncbi:hypothetical protein ASG52_20695 [Methylobacterium sp. Leaf456]|uniref:hypothetical protein n=1 Tax=Methylobacterium sp. Leaf456 TaxID=1736382 RepID=UPI0006F2204B|nr:hypothetical protein [Methylobacterium sp. Leaf456]KQT59796.1 hypothetical protein ASG52_20695 [Methylobacterium sp. Leaf456]
MALPVWKALQKRLVEVFHGMGSDAAAAPTANLCLVGTTTGGFDVGSLSARISPAKPECVNEDPHRFMI